MRETNVGKSALLLRSLLNKFSRDHFPTIEDIFSKRMTVDEEVSELDILDTSGDSNYRLI